MDFNDFFYYCLLQGFEIMGMSKKRAEKIALLKENQRKYQEFVKQFDLKPIVEYFEYGLEAQVFTDKMTGKILQKNENLFWGFNHAGYQYLLARKPIRKAKSPLQDILNEARREKNFKYINGAARIREKTKVEGEVFPPDKR